MTDARDALQEGRSIEVRPRGHSMSGVIEDGQAVVLEPVDVAELRVGDAVFVAWKRSFLLHLVVELDPTRVRIGNAKGRINGWSPRSAVLGRAVGVRAKAAKDGR